MNKYIVFTAFALATIVVNNSINAYNFPILNQTGSNYLIQVELTASSQPFFVFTKAGETADFSWPYGSNAMGAYCISNIKGVPVDNALYQKMKDANIIDKDDKIVDRTKVIGWLDENKIERTTASLRIDPTKNSNPNTNPLGMGGRCQDINFRLQVWKAKTPREYTGLVGLYSVNS